ncbi:Uncharacterised protein [Mycobacterium tuberculosis]|nr:Uncharacterised protein [Mycobacterium tuberculosis]
MPRPTGRVGSELHSDHDPGNSSASSTAGNVDGAGDVTGNRIHGLDIAAETFRYARIEQRHTTRTGLLRR